MASHCSAVTADLAPGHGVPRLYPVSLSVVRWCRDTLGGVLEGSQSAGPLRRARMVHDRKPLGYSDWIGRNFQPAAVASQMKFNWEIGPASILTVLAALGQVGVFIWV